MPKIPRREFLQLAGTYDPEKHDIGGWYISEKLDGTRCFWDGGISTGLRTEEVPYAAILDPKTGKTKGKIKEIATGLWSRYGNPISAPHWFVDSLPAIPLDGELWAGRGKFQINRSIVSKHEPSSAQWEKIKFAIYGSPPWAQFLSTGEIKNNNMVANFNLVDMQNWVYDRIAKIETDCICDELAAYQYDDSGDYEYNDNPVDDSEWCHAHVMSVGFDDTFENEITFIREQIANFPDDAPFFLLEQVKLPDDNAKAQAEAKRYFNKLVKKGAEGCIIRDPKGIWTPKRHNGLLKYKPVEDAEATVIGFVAGEKGKKGERLGRIGGLLLRCSNALNNVEFELGVGLNREEQELSTEKAKKWATENPGKEMPKGTRGKHFKVGDIITFQYRELTDKGLPKEARYFRHRDAE